jgi:hypothetical protein
MPSVGEELNYWTLHFAVYGDGCALKGWRETANGTLTLNTRLNVNTHLW